MSNTVTTTTDSPTTHRQDMMQALNDADFWHEVQATTRVNKKKKLLHRKYQQAIWWAIQQIEANE